MEPAELEVSPSLKPTVNMLIIEAMGQFIFAMWMIRPLKAP
jgi:hypothetical protein